MPPTHSAAAALRPTRVYWALAGRKTENLQNSKSLLPILVLPRLLLCFMLMLLLLLFTIVAAFCINYALERSKVFRLLANDDAVASRCANDII